MVDESGMVSRMMAVQISVPAPADEVANMTAEEYSFVLPSDCKPIRKTVHFGEDQPLVDRTAALPLNSKKTKRLRDRQMKKKQKQSRRSEMSSFLDLPPELLLEVLEHLLPSDILLLLRLNRATRDFILNNEGALARETIRSRYWVLGQCFPLPVALDSIDSSTRTSLLNSRRQEMLKIHKKPYQHVRPIDPLKICSCTTCLLGWNNLCLVLDLAHHQANLNNRQPIPMIPHGTTPEWNTELTEFNAAIVERAMTSPLTYATILEKHLATTSGTLLRTFQVRVSAHRNAERTLTNPKSMPKTMPLKRLYQISVADAEKQTDEFLERTGPPSHEFPFHRDNYYGIQAYIPNRRWSKEEDRWRYYGGMQHDQDLLWARTWFKPKPEDAP